MSSDSNLFYLYSRLPIGRVTGEEEIRISLQNISRNYYVMYRCVKVVMLVICFDEVRCLNLYLKIITSPKYLCLPVAWGAFFKVFLH